ncbi:MAG: phospholipase [Chloroflexi bacterium]|nr:MAG: phospholipase [Chloroflexota bacterium]
MIHQNQQVYLQGAPLEEARAAVVMLHGRGATAQDILTLANEFPEPGVAYLAPQAYANTWYPNRFMEPTETNEPWLSSALQMIQSILNRLEAANIPPERTILLGFSQGGCLALEYAALHARHYGGVAGLSGGLIGADGEERPNSGDFDGTPIFLGCDEQDFHIPAYRVHDSAETLRKMGGDVTVKLYQGLGHAVNAEELEVVRSMIRGIQDNQSAGK